MKRKLFLIAGLFMMFAFTSCKKSWTCKCSNGVMFNGAIQKSADVFADSKEEALEKCNKRLNKKDDLYCNVQAKS